MAPSAKRVGIIGLGFIGGALYQRLNEGATPGPKIGFVHDRRPESLAVARSPSVRSTGTRSTIAAAAATTQRLQFV